MSSRLRNHPSALRRELKKAMVSTDQGFGLDVRGKSQATCVLDKFEQERLAIRVSNFSDDADDAWDSDSELGPRFFTPLPRGSLPISPCDPSLYDADDEADRHRSWWPQEPHELQDDYVDGRFLIGDIVRHIGHLDRSDVRFTSMWKYSWSDSTDSFFFSPSIALSSHWLQFRYVRVCFSACCLELTICSPEPSDRRARCCDKLGIGEHYFTVPHVGYLSSKKRPHLMLVMVSDHSAEENSLLRSEVRARNV